MKSLPAHIRRLRRVFRKARLTGEMTAEQEASAKKVLYPPAGTDEQCAKRDTAWRKLKDQIDDHAYYKCGVALGSLSDSKILQWFRDHWKDILKIFFMVLPFII